jgi:tetratricopeptide (TPR) repeat protein
MNFRLLPISLATLCCTCGHLSAEVVQASPQSRSQQLADAASKSVADGDSATAERLLSEAIALDPSFCEGWVGLGMLKLRRQDIPGAKSAYEKALTLHAAKDSPSSSYHLLQQVFILRLLRRDSEAASIYAEASRRFPEDLAVKAHGSILTLDLDSKTSDIVALPKP